MKDDKIQNKRLWKRRMFVTEDQAKEVTVLRARPGRVGIGRSRVPVKTRRVAWTQGEVSDPPRRTLSFSLFFITPWMQGDTFMYMNRRQWRKQAEWTRVLRVLCTKWRLTEDTMRVDVRFHVSLPKPLNWIRWNLVLGIYDKAVDRI